MGPLAYIATRLSYRIAFVASMLAAGFTLAIGTVSYYVVRTQMAESINAVIRHDAALRAENVGSLLGSMVSTLSSLANNTLIANALVDSGGRDIYLGPFLRDLRSINGVPVKITLTDFEGKPLAANDDSQDGFAQSALASRVVSMERPLAQIQKSPEGDILILGEPVIYVLTGRAEGAMLVRLRLASLISGNKDGAEATGAAGLRYRYSAGETPEVAPQAADETDPGTDAALRVVQPVAVADALASLELAVEVTADQRLMSRPLRKLSAVYLVFGFAAVMVILLLGLGAGRRLVQPLRELERVARSVVASGSFDRRFAIGGVDEVARLGELFNRMLERLGQAYSASEQQAAALSESEQRYRAIFDTTTAAILELDISQLRTVIAELRQDGMTDFSAYLDVHPEVLRQSARHMAVVAANRAALRIFQVQNSDDLVGPLEPMLLPESYAVLRNLVVAVDEQLDSISTEMLLRAPGRECRDILMGAYIPGAQAQPARMLLSMVDITKRKAAEQELLRTNTLLHAIGQAQGLYITAAEPSESEAFNKLLDNLLESTESEYGFIGEVDHTEDGRPYLRTHAITNIAWNEESRKLFESRGPRGLEFTNLNTLFGAVMTSRQPVITNRPAQDPRAGGLPPGHPSLDAFLGIPFISGDEMVGMAGIANRPGGYDPTLIDFLQPLVVTCTGLIQAIRGENRRRQSERKLHEEQQRLDMVLETAPLILWAFDREGQFLLSRGKGLLALGLKEDEVVGRSVFDLYRDSPDVLEASRRALSGETVRTSNRIGGRWYDVRYEPIRDDSGTLRGCVGAALDVTEGIQAERALARYRNALEEQVRERTEAYEEIKRYAYIFSHDLRGPLVSAKGFVGELRLDIGELLQITQGLPDGLAQSETERLQRLMQESIPEALGFVEASVDKIDILTSALLNLSRAGSREFHYEAVDMRALVTAALEALAYPIEKAGIQVDVDQLPMVWADRSGVAQVVDNLLRNAINYLKPDVQGKIAVMGERNDGEAIFSVRDNGIGIAKDELQRIFEPFRRIVTHATPGEGMGLTFVQTLMRRMGGRIWCESELGVGSTFSCAIPVRRAQEIDTQTP